MIVTLIAGMVGCGDTVGDGDDGESYTLTIDSTAGGTVTVDNVPIPGKAVFTYGTGTVVNLNATPSAGYWFLEWAGDVSAIANVSAATTTITMSGDYSIVANFDTYEIDVNPTIYVPSTIRVVIDDGSVQVMNLDEYVKGVIAAEIGSGWPTEALKAQAVAARTFAVNNTHHDHCDVDVCSDHNCCQAWKGPPYDTRIVDAVTSTYIEVITYNGTIIREALFFSHCDGHTRHSENYDGWDYVPYLRGVSCGCAHAYGWTDRNSHGVGMCQYGARVMAEQGFSYVDVLKHYYSGVAIACGHTV
jgi:peptidoglycan hydrolase-like amidase